MHLFYSNCKEFIIECVLQIQSRFSSCSDFNFLSFVAPIRAIKLALPSFCDIYRQFPYFSQVAPLNEVNSEWGSYAFCNSLSRKQTTEEYWKSVFYDKNSVGEFRNKNLKKVQAVLLLLPYSNAYYLIERVFSQLKQIKTQHRTGLKQ